MTPDEFVSALAARAPTIDQLTSAGYTDERAALRRAEFFAQRRPDPIALPVVDDALVALLRGWDVSSIRIGGLVFKNDPTRSGDRLDLGRVESDTFALDLRSGECVVYDHEAPGRVLCRAARTGEYALAGLLLVADYYAKTSLKLFDFDDREVGARTSASCVAALGGQQYHPFATLLLGF